MTRTVIESPGHGFPGKHTRSRTVFHYKDNLFFGRMASGSVRILKFSRTPAEYPSAEGFYKVDDDGLLFDAIVDADSWGSVVSSVSAGGEESGRWYEAMDFHYGRLITNPVACTHQIGLACECGEPVGANGKLEVYDLKGVTTLRKARCAKCYEALGKP